MNLAKHTKANRAFFEAGSCPSKAEWRAWVLDGTVKGKVVGDAVFIDMNHFAANDVMRPENKQAPTLTGLDLLG